MILLWTTYDLQQQLIFLCQSDVVKSPFYLYIKGQYDSIAQPLGNAMNFVAIGCNAIMITINVFGWLFANCGDNIFYFS